MCGVIIKSLCSSVSGTEYIREELLTLAQDWQDHDFSLRPIWLKSVGSINPLATQALGSINPLVTQAIRLEDMAHENFGHRDPALSFVPLLTRRPYRRIQVVIWKFPALAFAIYENSLHVHSTFAMVGRGSHDSHKGILHYVSWLGYTA